MSGTSYVSPEAAALILFDKIAKNEKRIDVHGQQTDTMTREWILQTYSDCRDAIYGTGSKPTITFGSLGNAAQSR